MKAFRYVAAALISAAFFSTSASAAQVLYAFDLKPTSFENDAIDDFLVPFYSRTTSGTFGFDTDTNQLMSFYIPNWDGLDYDPTNGYQVAYPAVLALFDAAGPCDLDCFIGSINSGNFRIEYTATRYQLNFGSPLDGSILGTGPSGVGRQFNVAGNLVVTGSIPEPSTWATMLIGFGAIGYSMRRRRRPQSAIALKAM